MNFFEKLKNKFISKSKSEKINDTDYKENFSSINENNIYVTTVAGEIEEKTDFDKQISDNEVIENKVTANTENISSCETNIDEYDFSINTIEKNIHSEKNEKIIEDNTINNEDTENIVNTNSISSVDCKNQYTTDTLASEIIKNKLLSCGGCAKVYGLNNGEYTFSICDDGKSFSSPSLPSVTYDFTVFDIIVNLLNSKGGKAKKGVGRGKGIRLGDAGCEIDTVVGVIAKEYWKKNIGDSVLDPVFIMAAILQWAEICDNKRGYIEIKK